MSISRILGLILLGIGIVCLGFGWNSSDTVMNQAAQAATGRFTQPTMWYIFSGIALVLGGGALFLGGRPKP